MALFQEGYELQRQGLWADAMARYRESIRLHPTAEAHTFLGWVYSFMKLYDEAIQECKLAIAVDPSFGNPYTDIGAYLVEMDRLDEAILWFERAILARRYDARCYPYYNLGRIYALMGDAQKSRQSYEKLLADYPEFMYADLVRAKLAG